AVQFDGRRRVALELDQDVVAFRMPADLVGEPALAPAIKMGHFPALAGDGAGNAVEHRLHAVVSQAGLQHDHGLVGSHRGFTSSLWTVAPDAVGPEQGYRLRIIAPGPTPGNPRFWRNGRGLRRALFFDDAL